MLFNAVSDFHIFHTWFKSFSKNYDIFWVDFAGFLRDFCKVLVGYLIVSAESWSIMAVYGLKFTLVVRTKMQENITGMDLLRLLPLIHGTISNCPLRQVFIAHFDSPLNYYLISQREPPTFD